MRAFLLTVSQ